MTHQSLVRMSDLENYPDIDNKIQELYDQIISYDDLDEKHKLMILSISKLVGITCKLDDNGMSKIMGEVNNLLWTGIELCPAYKEWIEKP